MKKIIILAIFNAILFASSVVYSQNVDSGSKKEKGFPYGIENTSSKLDNRFDVHNYSFFKRLSSTGATQELNVNFELRNKTPDTIKLRVLFFAYHEKGTINKKLRRIVPYPKWRTKDLGKEDLQIVRMDTYPKVTENSEVAKYHFPDLLQMMQDDSGLGEPIVLKGFSPDNTPIVDKQQIYVHCSALKTTVFGKLYVPFNEGNVFFNHFGLIIADVETGDVVYSQLIRFPNKFKVY